MGLGVAGIIRLLHSAGRQCRHARHRRQRGGGDKSKRMKLLRVCSELCLYRGARAGRWTPGRVSRESVTQQPPSSPQTSSWRDPALGLRGDMFCAGQRGSSHRLLVQGTGRTAKGRCKYQPAGSGLTGGSSSRGKAGAGVAVWLSKGQG